MTLDEQQAERVQNIKEALDEFYRSTSSASELGDYVPPCDVDFLIEIAERCK